MHCLLVSAKLILSQWEKLHLLSVQVGRLETIGYSGVIDLEIEQCRKIIERADRLCADIDRLSDALSSQS
jgi:hypothetical protein